MNEAIFTSREEGRERGTAGMALIERPERSMVRVRSGRGRRGVPQFLAFAFLIACVTAFSVLFAVKLSGAERSALAVFRSAKEGGNDGEEDEKLGRLKLISAPGLVTVFAPSDRPIMPLAAEGGAVGGDMLARIWAPAGTEVYSVLPGTVRSVSDAPDGGATFGGMVTVAHEGGIEITYYGLGSIAVERGQKVLQRTLLGTLEKDVLFLRVTKDGRPIDPLEFLGVSARLG